MSNAKQVFNNYYQLSKPGIIYGNIITVVAGYFFARSPFDAVEFLGVIIGVALVIAGACVVNNIFDRSIDTRMIRTKKRPLVTGRISILAASVYGAIIAILGFGVLLFTQNWLATVLVFIAYVDYVIAYGVVKRRSPLGTHVGTISGALPLVVGYVAATATLDVAAVLLFLLMTVWQMAHFYGIALFRKKDYARANIPVLPVAKGNVVTRRRTIANIVRFIIVAAVLFVGGFIGYIGGILLVLAGVWWLRTTLDLKTDDDVIWGRKVFGSSLSVMLVMSLCLTLGNWLP